MLEKKHDISVIMATYNPIWEKCVFTLDSIIGQRDVDFELIVVDDGSQNVLFDRFESYFRNKAFNAYKLISHKRNQGTVKNCYDGLLAASGKYIKLISPGDALFNENTLSEWIKNLNESGRNWSFAEAIYYSSFDESYEILKVPVAPRVIDCYLKNKTELCRWNYVVLEDYPLGAAIVCDRKLFTEYLGEVLDKVIYAEDLSYVLMMYDNILPFYYSKPCVFYEFGCGVSTTKDNKWRKRFQNDLTTIELIVLKREENDSLQERISKALLKMNSRNGSKKRLIKNLQKGGLKKVLKYRLAPRVSSVDISDCGKWWK